MAIEGIPAALEFFKLMLKRAKDSGDAEFVRIAAEAHEAFIDLRENNLGLREQLSESRDQVRALEARIGDLEDLGSVWENDGSYWKPLPDGSWDGPYCTVCYDTKQQLVRSEKHGGGSDRRANFYCLPCKRSRVWGQPPSHG